VICLLYKVSYINGNIVPIKITRADENRNILLYTKKPDFPNQFSIFLDLEKYSIFFDPIKIKMKPKNNIPNNK
jgi:hypothetical protein